MKHYLATLKNNPLRTRIVIALSSLLVVMIAVWGVFSYSTILLTRQSEEITNTDVPNTVGALVMLDALNNMRFDLAAYIEGDPEAQFRFIDTSSRFTEARENLDASVISETDLLVIDTLFANALEEAQSEVFSRFDPVTYNESVGIALQLRQSYGDHMRDNINALVLGEINDANANRDIDDIIDDDLPGVINYLQLWDAVSDMLTALDQYVLNNADAPSAFFNASLNAENILLNLRALETEPDEIPSLEILARNINELRDGGEYIFVSQELRAREHARLSVDAISERSFGRIAAKLDTIANESSDKILHQLDRLNNTFSVSKRVVDIAMIASIVFGLFIAYYVMGHLLKPVGEVTRLLTRLRKGNYDNDFSYAGRKDEIGEIFNGLSVFQTSLIELEELRSEQLEQVEALHLEQLQTAYDDLKRSETNIREQNVKMAKVNTELEQFVHIASHDLREPLKNIMGHCSMLDAAMEIEGADTKHRLLLDRIMTGANRMCVLIDDLRGLTKLQNVAEQFVHVDLDAALSEAIAERAEELHDKKAVFNIKSLPMVSGHRSFFDHMFASIVDNIVKYGASPLILNVRTIDSDDTVTIRISNNYDGPLEKTQELFLPFRRGRNVVEGSSGVGLALVKKIVEELHHGEVMVEEDENQTFTLAITLPMRVAGDQKNKDEA